MSQRFAYEEVMPIIEADDSQVIEGVTPEIRKLLKDMHHLAMILRKRRFEKGALELDMPEVRLSLNPDGEVTGAYETEHDESHQVIEEFMLAANIAVAVKLKDEGIDFLRRVHADPAETKLKTLKQFVEALGFELGAISEQKTFTGIVESGSWNSTGTGR